MLPFGTGPLFCLCLMLTILYCDVLFRQSHGSVVPLLFWRSVRALHRSPSSSGLCCSMKDASDTSAQVSLGDNCRKHKTEFFSLMPLSICLLILCFLYFTLFQHLFCRLLVTRSSLPFPSLFRVECCRPSSQNPLAYPTWSRIPPRQHPEPLAEQRRKPSHRSPL